MWVNEAVTWLCYLMGLYIQLQQSPKGMTKGKDTTCCSPFIWQCCMAFCVAGHQWKHKWNTWKTSAGVCSIKTASEGLWDSHQAASDPARDRGSSSGSSYSSICSSWPWLRHLSWGAMQAAGSELGVLAPPSLSLMNNYQPTVKCILFK